MGRRRNEAHLALLLALGCQYKTIDAVAGELELPANQALALFNKLIRKFAKHLRMIKEAEVAAFERPWDMGSGEVLYPLVVT